MILITTYRVCLTNTLKQFGFFLIAVTAATTAVATTTTESDETPWYEVNMVIFSHNTGGMGSENWQNPALLNLRFPATTINMGDDSPAGKAFTLRAPSDEEFKQSLRRIKNSSNYTVLIQKTWLQPGYDKKDALPILIQGGDAFGDEEYGKHYALEGTVSLSLSRYLHFQANLWFSEYEMQSITTDNWWDNAEQPLPNDNRMMQPDILSHETTPLPAPNPDDQTTRLRAVKTVVMNESRRMRSGKIHYLDHPLFGILVKINVYEPPAPPVVPPEAIDTIDVPTDALTDTPAQTIVPATTTEKSPEQTVITPERTTP